MSKRIVQVGGLAAVGGAAYYLYSAGGDPKLAEKKFEHDAAAAARKARGELPGREKEAKKAGEEGFEAVRAKAEQYSEQAKAEAKRAQEQAEAYAKDASKKLEQARQDTGAKLNQAVDQFDKTVTEKTTQSKSWLGSWFGGK